MRSRDDSLRGSSCAFWCGQSTLSIAEVSLEQPELNPAIYMQRKLCVYPSSPASEQYREVPVHTLAPIPRSACCPILDSTYIPNGRLLIDLGLKILEDALVDHLVWMSLLVVVRKVLV